MTEFSSPENPVAPLRHPAVILLGEFEAAYSGGEWGAQADIDVLQRIETERDRPGGFRDLVATQDLDSISTTAQIMERATNIVAELQPMTPEERFDTVSRWRKMADIGSSLNNTAEKSIRLAVAMQKLGLQDKAMPELSLEELGAVYTKMHSPDALHDHFPFRHNPDIPAWRAMQDGQDEPLPLLPPTPQDAPDHIKQAEDFAQYNDGVKAYLLFLATAEMSADLIGRDLLSGEPVIHDYMVNSFERAQAYTRPLPERISGWRDRGLVDGDDVPESIAGGFGKNYDMVRHVATIIAGAAGEEIAELYIGPYREFYDFLDSNPAHWNPDAPIEEQNRARLKHRDLNNKLPEASRLFRSRILDELMLAFAEATASIHPTIEDRARHLATYTLSGGRGWHIYHEVLEEARSEPLAAAVSKLQSIAEEEGFGGTNK